MHGAAIRILFSLQSESGVGAENSSKEAYNVILAEAEEENADLDCKYGAEMEVLILVEQHGADATF